MLEKLEIASSDSIDSAVHVLAGALYDAPVGKPLEQYTERINYFTLQETMLLIWCVPS